MASSRNPDWIGVAFGLAVLLAAEAAAAKPTTTWKCVFGASATYLGKSENTWSANEFGIRVERFELTFIDVGEKAYVVGNAGSSEVFRIPVASGAGGIQFIEQTGSGAVQVTAIDAMGNAVHSRHSQVAGRLVPAQYYGRCARS